MKKLKKHSLIILIAIVSFWTFDCSAQQIIPIPIIMSSGGNGESDPKLLLAAYLTITFFCIVSMFVRLIVIRRHISFKKQTVFKNFFYELDDFEILKPSLNLGSMTLILMNGLALLCIMIVACYEMLN